jgi:hypothetical protein
LVIKNNIWCHNQSLDKYVDRQSKFKEAKGKGILKRKETRTEKDEATKKMA